MKELKSVFAYIIFLLSVAYIISPIDIIPDVIPIAGWIDDILIFLGE